MNKLTDAFVLSNGVKVPCVGFGCGTVLGDETLAGITAMPELGFTGWLPENAPADATV